MGNADLISSFIMENQPLEYRIAEMDKLLIVQGFPFN